MKGKRLGEGRELKNGYHGTMDRWEQLQVVRATIRKQTTVGAIVHFYLRS